MKKTVFLFSILFAVSCGSSQKSNLKAESKYSLEVENLDHAFSNNYSGFQDFKILLENRWHCDLISALGDQTNQYRAEMEISFTPDPEKPDMFSNKNTNNLGFTRFAKKDILVGATSDFSGDKLRLTLLKRRDSGSDHAYLKIEGINTYPDSLFGIKDSKIVKMTEAEFSVYTNKLTYVPNSSSYGLAYGICSLSN